MAGVTGASLATLNNKSTQRNRRGAPQALFYPNDLKADSDKNIGQDNVEFALYHYAKKLTPSNERTPFPNNTPFPSLLKRISEESNYAKDNIYIQNLGSVHNVFLPIQDKIQDQNSVSWGEGTLNDIQRRLANLSYSVMNANQLGISDAGKELGNFLSDPGTGQLGRLAAVEQAIGIQNLLSRATGTILNPNIELLFEKPSLRPFTFNFRLSPRDNTEGDTVKSIIKFFKQGMAPQLIFNSELFLKTPRIFKIRYHYGSKGGDHPGINKIKMCALQNCYTDYTPNNSYMTYHDGTMISYNVNLTFQELIPLYSKDYEDDHSIGF
jgi:hypothetical protein